MIYFKENLIIIADELKTSIDHIDELNDLIEINNTISRNDIYSAINLDEKLRKKYPIIDIMLNVANLLPRRSSGQPTEITQQNSVINSLIQDKYGIYAHILLKGNKIFDLKDFIDYVD